MVYIPREDVVCDGAKFVLVPQLLAEGQHECRFTRAYGTSDSHRERAFVEVVPAEGRFSKPETSGTVHDLVGVAVAVTVVVHHTGGSHGLYASGCGKTIDVQ